ncbi:hypothetical protein [Micromonospora carbonacea]|uniref:Uncharacterized protein n=1 Tax=Micromonospora carbonacea TaxID=47853 RepID=A0A1C4VMQ6_9ACTN|nr:hypothetical protein [Micromonospora carbonacea]SCE85236.1 hypothetical protein GA0070563_102389 [Micromonospora carbonacea]
MSGTALTSTTRRTLLRLLWALLAANAVALAGCLAAFLGVQRTTEAAYDRSVPAILAVYDTQVALREAHGAAVASFAAGTRLLAGPGEDYQNQIARAGQHLAEIAEDNAAGDDGSRDIQVVEASLVTYAGLIERAHAHFAQPDGRALGTAALRDASGLLEEILLRLDRLEEKQDAALDRQVDGAWTGRATSLLWLLPVLALGALLVAAQLFLRRRFRRALNAPLLLATLAVLALGGTTATSLHSTGQLGDARAATDRAAAARGVQLTALADRNATQLAALLRTACAPTPCADTIEQVLDQRDGDRTPAGAANEIDAAGSTAWRHGQDATGLAARAANSRGGEVVLPTAALLAAALVVVGFLPRLEEYRYRQR